MPDFGYGNAGGGAADNGGGGGERKDFGKWGREK